MSLWFVMPLPVRTLKVEIKNVKIIFQNFFLCFCVYSLSFFFSLPFDSHSLVFKFSYFNSVKGNASLHTWWGDMLGPNRPFDTNKYFIVCSNILGSCYGSTSPRSRCPYKNTFYGMDFPDVSVQDTVRLQLHMLQDELGIQSVKSVIGGSFGGMQAVEYAAQAGIQGQDSFLRSVIPIACGAAHTAWQIGISEVQRQAIYADPNWRDGSVEHHLTNPPLTGLSVARQIGMVSYRTPRGYENKFGRGVVQHKNGETDPTSPPTYGRYANWQVKSYLDYQGQKFLSRFDAITYVKLTEQMDSHDVGRNRGGKVEALSKVQIPALVIGIDSDILYPLHEQEELASLLPNAQLKIVNSDAGHDGFLLEQTQVGAYINAFLSTIK
jgi:homoserine O-acetyltransferase